MTAAKRLDYAGFTCRGIGINVVAFISLAAMEAVGFTQKEGMTMPPSQSSSQAEFIRETEKLLTALASNPSLVPNMSQLTDPLVQTLSEIKVLSARQEELKADKQKATQDLRAAFDRAHDQAIRIRAAVKAWVGPRSEKLVQFQVAPLRRRSRKGGPVEESPSPVPVQEASPETSAETK